MRQKALNVVQNGAPYVFVGVTDIYILRSKLCSRKQSFVYGTNHEEAGDPKYRKVHFLRRKMRVIRHPGTSNLSTSFRNKCSIFIHFTNTNSYAITSKNEGIPVSDILYILSMDCTVVTSQ